MTSRSCSLAPPSTTETYRQEGSRPSGIALVTAGVSSRQQAAEARHTADLATRSGRRRPPAGQPPPWPILGGAADQAPESLPRRGSKPSAAQEATRITLSYTTVVAPSDGIVARVDQLQKGAYVNAGADPVLPVLSGEPWVEANFKEESAAARCASANRRRIVIDALGGKGFSGHVESFSPGAGSPPSPHCRRRTRRATGSRSSSGCRCGSPSTRRRRKSRGGRGSARR